MNQPAGSGSVQLSQGNTKEHNGEPSPALPLYSLLLAATSTWEGFTLTVNGITLVINTKLWQIQVLRLVMVPDYKNTGERMNIPTSFNPQENVQHAQSMILTL